MFDPLRSENDVVEDIKRLNNICQDYQKYKSLWEACARKHGVKSATPCECRDYKNDMSFQDRLNCPKCGGFGYTFEYDKEGE